MRIRASVLIVLVCASTATSQDAIKAEKVQEVKAGSVFIRNQTENARSSGSGFVIATMADGSLICTNSHVVTPDFAEKQSPTQLLAKVRNSKLTIVFDSGLTTERSAPAEVVSIDPTIDLAILKVKSTDLKNLPKPLKIDGAKALAETATVYSFGFPLGDRLSTGKGPAITVGKASVSSLRTDDQGKLATIQIDGSLNPGNSGGPVVDADGTVIGVAVAIARDSQGIGFVIPVAEVQSMLAGRVAMLQAEYQKQNDGKVKVLFEAHISNPLGKITGANLFHAWMESGAEKLKGSSDLRQLAESKIAVLKVDGAIAKGEFTVDKSDGQVAYCVVPIGGSTATGPVTVVALSRAVKGKQGIGEDDKPPAGWKEVQNNFVTFWVPEKSSKPVEKSRDVRNRNVTASFVSTLVNGDNGLAYALERASIRVTGVGAGAGQVDMKALRDNIVKAIADDLKGRIVEEVDVKMGVWKGKEYTIKAGNRTSMIRIATTTFNIYILHVHGASDIVAGEAGELFLNSFRFNPPKKPDAVAVKPDPAPGTTTPPRPNPVKPVPGGTATQPPTTAPAGSASDLKATEASGFPLAVETMHMIRITTGESDIVAGGNDAITKDFGPEKGMMVGMQIGLGKFVNNDIVVAVRPVYRTDNKDTFGTGRGITNSVKTLMAKEGYAIGGIMLSSGLTVDGIALVFMKVNGDKLDPKDSYQSPMVGNASKVPNQYIHFDGAPVIGITCRSNPRTNNVTGMGFIFDSPDAAESRRTSAAGTSTEILGGFNDPIYRDIAPDGGFLIGLEVGLKSERNMDFIRGMKPIYMTGDKESTGKQYGTAFDKTMTVKAKPGYAIASVSAISGLRTDGLMVTFMKIDGKGLNLKDSYTSEWIGASERKQPKVLTGGGKPIIGITGKQNDRENTGFGLIVQATKN